MKGYHEGRRVNKFFMGLISIVLCFSIIGASTMTAFAATPVEAANDTAEKLQFMGIDSIEQDELCLVVFDDMAQNGADSEGRAIIGGDLTITGSWSASVKQPYPDEYVLMVGGNILEGGINSGGCVAIGGGAYSEANLNVSGYCSHGGSDAVHVDNSGWIADYIGKAEQAFTAASAQYANLPADGTSFVGGWEAQWNIIADPNHVAGQPHVFYVDLTNSWSKNLSEVHFYGDFGNDAIIININGGTVNFTGGGGVMIKGAGTVWNAAAGQNVTAEACTSTMEQLKSNIIWNCYEAETVKISAYAIQGSLLAPYATVTGDNGHVNGTTVVKNMIGAGGFEYHTGHFFKNPFSAALEVSKVVEGTPDAAAETEFSFQLQKADGTVVETFTLTNGQTWRFSDLEENVTYKVVELASSDYYTFDRAEATGSVDSISGKTVTFTATDGSSRDITFYNDAVETVKEGSITVKKTLDDAVDPNAEFTFKLEYYDNGWQEISAVVLGGGESHTFTGLTLGTYRVTETVDTGMYTTSVQCSVDSGATVATSKEITLSDSLIDETVTFTNTRNYGSINVSKTVNGTDAQDSFTFRLYKEENGSWVSAGVNDITVTAGSTASFSGLPYGVTYAVAELSSENYSFASVYGGTNESLTIDGYPAVKVTVGSNANIYFTNTLKTANLTVTKTVVGTGDAQDTFSFTLQKQNGSSWTTVETFTLKAGEVKSFTGLTANSVYRVYESSVGDIYERGAITGADSISEDIYAVFTLNADENRTISFTNEVKPGSITVKKNVNDGYANAQSSFAFTLYESADNGTNWNAVETFTLAAGETRTFTGLDTEKVYKVVESEYANYDTTVKVGSSTVNGADTGAFEIYPNADTSVVYTNNRKTADLTVKKVINGTPFSADDSFTFRLYELSGTRWIYAGADVTVKANGTAKFENLAYGVTYAVAEVNNAEYTFTSVAGGTAETINEMNAVYVTVNGDAEITFTNTPIPKIGGFTVTKSVSGYGIASDEFTFKVEKHAVNRWVEVETFTLKAGESKTFSNLTAGDVYRVTETSIPDAYELVSVTGADSVENNVATVTIADKACPGIVFTNEVKTGSIKVTKTISDKHDNAATSFSFTAYESADGKTWTALETFTLKNGESKTISDLDVTMYYKVVEADYSATYKTVVAVSGISTAALDSGSFKLTADKATNVDFTNTRKTASITVNKAMDGEAYEGDTFTFRLYKLVDGNWVAAGVDDITVKPNGSAVFTNLAYGNTYAVVELEAEEYTLVSVTGTNVTVDGLTGSKFVINGDADVTFTNKPIPRLGGFTVTKQLTGGNASDEFSFTVQKKDGSSWKDFDSFTLRAGDSKIYTDLVEGEVYRIYESETGAIYELASITGADSVEGDRYAVVTIVEGGNPTVAFTNKVKQGTITVTKTLTDEALDGTSTFKFELQKLNGSVYERVEVKELTVGHGAAATVTFENLPYNETYRVVELEAEDYDTTTVFEGAPLEGKTSAGIALDGDENVEFKNVRKVKIVVGKVIAEGDTDHGEVFTFLVQKKNGAEWVTVETVTMMASDKPVEFVVETGTYRVLEMSGSEGYSYAHTAVTGGVKDVTEITATIDGVLYNGVQFVLMSDAEASVENCTNKGNIILSKIVSDTVTPDREFTFTLQQLVNGAWTDVLKADGAPVTVVLKHGEAVDLNQVAVLEYGSVYRVVETADSSIYETTIVTNGEHSTGTASGSVTIGSKAATIAFTNTRRNAQLKIVKALTAESNDLGESFEISVYKYTEANGWTLLTAAEDGVDGTMTIKAGANNAKYVSLPVGATYKIVETATGKSYNFDSFSDNVGANSTITLMSDAEVIVYNAIKTGKLTISKTLNDDITPNAVFTFNVTDEDGKVVATGSITGGESFTVENLPYGKTYTVTEVVNSEVYETTVTVDGNTVAGAKATVAIDSAEASVAFENTRREGEVTITKMLSEGSNEFDEEFSFTLYRLSDAGWVEVESFDLGFNETHKVSLQIGAQYGIVETATGASYEFDTTVENTTYGQIVIGDVNNTGVLFTLGTEGQNVNVYNKNKTAKISVNKAVTGGEINGDEFTFTLQQKVGNSYVDVSTVTIKGGESAYFTENAEYPFYLGNEYRITEGTLGTRYELVEIVGADKVTGPAADFTLTADRDITFVNGVKQGSLTVKKTLNDNYDTDAEFTVIVRNADTGATLGSATIGGGESYTVENIPYGTKVEVTEVYNDALYTAVVNGLDENNTIVIDDANETVAFTNTRKSASLNVTKALADGGETLQKTFSMKLEMLKDGAWTEVASFKLKANEVKTFADLYAGVTYRVVETDTTESFAYGYWTDGTATYTEPDVNGATFVMDTDKNITIYNTLKTASLTIGKTIAVGGEWEEGESFTFVIEKYENGQWTEYETVTLTYEDRTWSSEELAVGEKYRVTETTIGYRYELDKIDGADSVDLTARNAEVVIDETGNTLLFTNKVKVGTVIVKKTLTDALDEDAKFTFVATNVETGETIATFELGNGDSFEIADLPYGTEVKISELGAENYNTTVLGVNAKETQFNVEDSSKTVTFDNTRKTASLTIDKALAAGSNDLGESFEFELQVNDGGKWTKVETFTLKAAESKTIANLSVGASYRLIETATGASYNYVGMSAGNPISGEDGVEFVLSGNTAITATNASRSASLTIEKIVKGNAYDDTFTFTVEKKDGNKWQAVETVTLGGDNGMSYIFTGLTVGDVYRVTETNLASRYTLTKIEGATSSSLTDGSAQVTIGNNGNTVTYTNTVKTGSVVIEKVLDDAFDTDAKFTFTAYNKTSGQSLGSKELGNGEKWEINGLEYGDVIEIEELSTGALYTTTAEGLENGTVTVSAPSAAVTFTNVRNTGALTVKKTVDAGAALGKSFTFALEVEKDGVWTAVDTFTLKADETKTIENLYVGATYRVVETDATDAYTFATATGGEVATIEAGSAVTFVAQTANAVEFVNSLKQTSLTITKTIAVGGEWVEGEKFTFIVEKLVDGEWVEFDTAVVTYEDRTWTTDKEVLVGDKFRVTETEIGYRYELSEIIGGENVDLTAKSAEVVVPVEGSTLVFVNEVKKGSLTVSKTLVDTVNPDETFAFTLYKYNAVTETYEVADSFSLGNGESKTFDGLLYGDLYKVVEQSNATLYETSYVVGEGSAVKSNEASVTIANAATDVKFTNTRATAKLTVDKALLNGATDEEFTFVLEKKLANGQWQTVETFALTAAAEPKAFNLEVETEYRITETVADGSSFEFANAEGISDGYVNGSSYYFTLKTNSDVVFNNQLKSAGLTVRKIAANAVDTDVFTFTLYKVNGSDAVAVETFQLKANEYKFFDGLLYGDKYIVKETDSGSRFEFATIDGADSVKLEEAYGVVEINGSEAMTFTNIIKSAEFTVTKTLTDNTTPDAAFTFEVYRNASLVDTFKLAGGESKTIATNSAYAVNFGDVFEIVEVGAENYTTTVTIDGAVAGDAKLTITNDSHEIGFENVRRKATLTVAKAIKEGDNLFADSFTFVLEQKLGDEWKQVGEAFTLAITPEAPTASADFELDVNGVYRVTETATGANYVFDSVVNATAVSGKSAGTLTLADDTTVTFVNTVKTGTVSVTKSLTDGFDPDAVFSFTAANAETGEIIEIFSLKADQTWVSPQLPYGTIVKITEADNENYTVTTGGLNADNTVTVLKDNTDVKFTNVRKSASLTVGKTVENGADLRKEFKFVLQMNHDGEWINITSVELMAGETKVFEDLYYGVEYRVIETDTSDSFDFVKVEGGTPVAVTEGDVMGNGASVVLTSNQTLNFVNKLKGAQLKITKDVEDLGDWLENEVFTFDIEKQNDDGTWTLVESIELTYDNKIFTMDAVVSDVYRIVETSDNYRYYLKSVAGADSYDLDTKEATVTIAPSGASVLFTNDVHEGNIVISKVWNDKYDVNRTFSFNIYKNGSAEPIDVITLANGESKVIESNDKYTVKYGDVFKVVETTGSDFTTAIKVDGANAPVAQVVINKATTAVEFTNVRATASLTVEKVLTDSRNYGESFEFELYQKDTSGAWAKLETFKLKANEKKTFDGLYVGVDYKVVETKTGSYNFLTASAKGADCAVSAEDKAVTLTLTGNTTVTVENIVKKASLTVNKSVVGADYGDTFSFKIEKQNADGTWTVVADNVSISANENYTWYSEASVGEVYRVTETTTSAKWTLTNVSVNGAEADSAKIGTAYKVTIVEDGSVIGFTNTAKTGSVVITKSVVDAFEPTAAFTFAAINLTTGEDYGVKTLANGESWTIEGVEYGDKVQVTETVDGSVYTTTVNGNEGTVITLDVIAGANKAAFVNTRKTASLTVSKTLTANGGAELGSEFKFALEVSKNGAWAEVETFTLKAGETKTISGLYVGASYRVIETDSTAAFSFYGVTGGTTLEVDGAELKLAATNAVEFTNDLNNATLTIRKVVEGGSAGADTFSFNIEKKNGSEWVALDETIVLSAENSYTWSKNDALVGDVYRITETELGTRYELTAVAGADEVDLAATNAVVTIGAEGNTVTFTNTVKTGEILVTKTLNDVINSGASFGFDLYKVENGEEVKAASFTLQNGQTWSSAEAGVTVKYGDSFVVRETCDTNTYATTITIDGATVEEGKVFTIAADETAVEFTNTRKTTDFELTKSVSGVTEYDEYFEIHMTGVFEDSNGETVTKKFVFTKSGEVEEPVEGVVYAKVGDTVDVEGVYYGAEYTIEEIGAEYYTCYINEIQTNKAVVKTDVTTKGDISNLRKTADLTVTKALTRGQDLGETFTFEVYASIDGEWVQQGEAFALKVGESKTLENLAIGLEYKVIETDTGASYMFGSVDADSSLISTETEKGASFLFTGDRTVTVSNIIKTDSITVRKQIVGKGGDMDTAFGFELQQLVKGEWVTVETFTLKANESKTFENLDLGETFKVIETDTGATFDFAGITIDNIGNSDKIDVNEQSATVVLNGAEDITFNNSPSIQKLTVEKKLTAASSDLGDKFGFHLYKEEDGNWILQKTFYLAAGETAEFETVNGEKFKVVEFETGNYYQLENIEGADTISLANNEAIVTTDTDETVTFTNELLTGSLTINKYTSGLVSNNEKFDFIITDDKGNAFTTDALTTGQFSLNAGGSVTINDIPYGTVIKVTENVDGSRFLTMYKVSGDDVTYQGASTNNIVINKGSTIVDFTNQSIETEVEMDSSVLGENDKNLPNIVNRTSGTVITGGTGGSENVGAVSTSTYTIRTDVLGESDYAPETGDSEVPVSVIILMAVSGLMVLILSKKRRVNA